MTECPLMKADTLAEEIEDLSRVLAAFPPSLTQTEAGRAYQRRLQELRWASERRAGDEARRHDEP